MSDDPGLAAIRASIKRDEDRPLAHYAQKDARTLLRRLDAMTAERDALAADNAALRAEIAQWRAERDALAAEQVQSMASGRYLTRERSMIDRYDVYGRSMEDTEPDRDAWFVRFDQHNDRIRELEAALRAGGRTAAMLAKADAELIEARAHAERLWQALIDIEEISHREGNEFWGALYKCGATARRALAATAPPGEGT